MRVLIPYAKDRNRRAWTAEEAQCLLCLRKLPATGTRYIVEISVGGEVIVDEPADGPDSQGSFEVGPDCWRKVEAALRVAGYRGGQAMEYGVRWQEVNRRQELVTKERFFRTEKMRDRYLEARRKEPRYYALLAICNPQGEAPQITS